MQTLISVVGAAVLVSGCGQVAEQVSQLLADTEPVLAIAPGYEVAIDGKPTPIFGADDCPKADPRMTRLFGPDPLADAHSCIVLSKDRTQVAVRFKQDGGLHEEIWTIVRGESKQYGMTFPTTGLRRPDGSMVVAAQ